MSPKPRIEDFLDFMRLPHRMGLPNVLLKASEGAAGKSGEIPLSVMFLASG